ncbi:DUF4328 domain-containing protein [Micromonospora sp. RP3T]|uniref:DUF4328 domain-containing protein n=1 Tax=Micromonospora sp. RP3T TaxID=2135446 RepID=UPI000D159A8F|nr:DUF4328 domain-containing protein [Micromonospora sp. RP3T]PTA42810.1 hypothetical protein C8054_28900 [Micromonospora sp. RP3T]
MHCQTCGDATSPAFDECQRCGTRHGQPPVLPGVPTYPVRGLGTAVCVAVGATAVLFTLSALFPLLGVRLARSAAEQLDRDVLLGAVLAEVLLTLPFILAVLVAATLVVIWTWRVRRNLDAFSGAAPTQSPAWAIAGWLVPFANFVVPARVVAEVARFSLWRRRTPWLVPLWWAAWLVFSVGERVVAQLEEQRYGRLTEWPRSEAEFATYVTFYREALAPRLLPVLACLVAAISFVVLVRRISTAQQDRIARARPGFPGWPGHPGWPGRSGWSGQSAQGGGPGWPTAGAAGPAPVAGLTPGAPVATSPQLPPGAGGTIGA